MEPMDTKNENARSNPSYRISVDEINNIIVNTDPSQDIPQDSSLSITPTIGNTIGDINKDISNCNNIVPHNEKIMTNTNLNRNNMSDRINANTIATETNDTIDNRVTIHRVTSDVQNSSNTRRVNITNDNQIVSDDSKDVKMNSDSSNNEIHVVSNRQKTSSSITNNNIVIDNSYRDNFNDTNSHSSNMNNRGRNSMNRKPERTSSSDTIQSTIYDLDVVNSDSDTVSVANIQVPIVGYEVMEERARFTVFKLKVEDLKSDRSWLVFRRYTDFVRLYTRLKSENVNVNLPLPGKRWFRDNFETAFLEERVRGLQVFINTVIRRLGDNKTVREFLCVEEPPGAWGWQAEALAGALQDTVSSLRRELQQREQREDDLVKEIERLRQKCASCELCKKRDSCT